MATSFLLELKPGYPSFANEVEIRKFLEKVPDKPDFKAIKKIALNCGCPKECSECGEKLNDFKEYIEEEGTASGAGDCRRIKEHLQRAKLIWILIEASKQEVNVNVNYKTI